MSNLVLALCGLQVATVVWHIVLVKKSKRFVGPTGFTGAPGRDGYCDCECGDATAG